MKSLPALILITAFSFTASCGRAVDNTEAPPAPAQPTPIPAASVAAYRDYPAKGKVTKVDMKSGSVELDHGGINGVVPAMKKEFYVIDDAILKDISVGDDVDFTLRHKDGQQIVTEIAKQK